MVALAVALSMGVNALAQTAIASEPSEVFSAAPSATSATVLPKPKKTDGLDLAPATRAGSGAMMSDDSPALRWFENYDMYVNSYQRTKKDKFILKRPLKQEAERVNEFTDTARKVAYNYRELAKAMRNSIVPAGHEDLADFSRLRADWYDDLAGIYEDMIRPRPPARTKEDLAEQLQGIKDRATSLNSSVKELVAMDMELRKKYRVHKDREKDPLYKYVSGGN